MKINYKKDVLFEIPHISALGMDPPEGKELSDFVCWMGFEDKDNPYLSNWFYNTSPSSSQNYRMRPLSSLIGARILSNQKCVLSSTDMTFNVYVCWDRYGWSNDLSGAYIGTGVQEDHIVQANVIYDLDKGNVDKYGFCSNSLRIYRITKTGGDKVLIPNYNIKYSIHASNGWKLNNVYLNGMLFAGKDVTEEYWNSHREDLFRGIDPELSVNHIWEDGKVNDSVQFIYPITSCHVSSDNCMHISCDAELLSGEYTVYSSYDEVKDKMTDNGSMGFF